MVSFIDSWTLSFLVDNLIGNRDTWRDPGEWSFFTDGPTIYVYNVRRHISLTFDCNGTITVIFENESRKYKSFQDKNAGKDAFLVWLRGTFPNMSI